MRRMAYIWRIAELLGDNIVSFYFFFQLCIWRKEVTEQMERWRGEGGRRYIYSERECAKSGDNFSTLLGSESFQVKSVY